MTTSDIVQTTASMTQAERDTINRANRLPNHEQRAAAHTKRLRKLGATAAEKRAHVASCESCSYGAASVAESKASKK